METTMAKTVEKITLFFENIYLVDDTDLQLKPPRNNVCYNVQCWNISGVRILSTGIYFTRHVNIMRLRGLIMFVYPLDTARITWDW